MSRVRAFFLEEATDCLRTARAELRREEPDRAVIYRAVRRVRGSAQLARCGAVARQAAALEARIRPRGEDSGWSPALAALAERGLTGLEAAVDAVRSGRTESEKETERTMDAEGGEEAVVGVQELEYRGEAALDRALELRRPIEDAIARKADAQPLLEELFDLIRLGRA